MNGVFIGQGSSHSYLLGFSVGVMTAKKEKVPPDDLLTAAVRDFFKACETMHLERDPFLIGWFKGFKAYNDGIIDERGNV